MPEVAVSGLAAEAKIARRAGLAAVAAGGDPARTRAALERLVAEGATALLSFGICGGLDPALAAGTLLLPRIVRAERGARFSVDAAWHGRVAAGFAARGIGFRTGDLLGVAAIVATPAEKAALHGEWGAIAADLESHLVAEVAVRARRPFLVLRAVADPASRALPPAALLGLDAEGRPVLGAVLGSLLSRPRQLPALLAVALDARRALHALRRAAPALTAPDAR
jgi:adenosylhomocysteine nucleosidase